MILIVRLSFHYSIVVALLIFAVPLIVSAETRSLWQFQTEEDLAEWKGTNIGNMALTEDGLHLRVDGDGVIYRSLPEGFPRGVDGIALKMSISSLSGAEIVFIEAAGENLETIVNSAVMPLAVSDDRRIDAIFSLSPYRGHIAKANVFALRMTGTAQDILVEEIGFVHQSLGTKISGALRSFFWFQPIAGHSINVLTGPVLLTDFDRFGTVDPNAFAFSTSVNAFFLIGLSLCGCGILLWGLRQATKRSSSWAQLRFRMDVTFLIAVLVVWFAYDLRMSTEILTGLVRDHQSYVFTASGKRELRDVGSIHDFAAFVRPLLAGKTSYEIVIIKQWPYLGILQYETYPVLPNIGEQNSDTWVIYRRPDMTIGPDYRLYTDGMPVSTPGIILGRYSDDSFVFRELNPSFPASSPSSQ